MTIDKYTTTRDKWETSLCQYHNYYLPSSVSRTLVEARQVFEESVPGLVCVQICRRASGEVCLDRPVVSWAPSLDSIAGCRLSDHLSRRGFVGHRPEAVKAPVLDSTAAGRARNAHKVFADDERLDRFLMHQGAARWPKTGRGLKQTRLKESRHLLFFCGVRNSHAPEDGRLSPPPSGVVVNSLLALSVFRSLASLPRPAIGEAADAQHTVLFIGHDTTSIAYCAKRLDGLEPCPEPGVACVLQEPGVCGPAVA